MSDHKKDQLFMTLNYARLIIHLVLRDVTMLIDADRLYKISMLKRTRFLITSTSKIPHKNKATAGLMMSLTLLTKHIVYFNIEW